jgi:hypothetical protein
VYVCPVLVPCESPSVPTRPGIAEKARDGLAGARREGRCSIVPVARIGHPLVPVGLGFPCRLIICGLMGSLYRTVESRGCLR